MTIEAYTLKSGSRLYAVMSESEKMVARFSTLEEAALVCRFLSNEPMPEIDYQRALTAIREYDATRKPKGG